MVISGHLTRKTGSLLWEFKLPAPAFATPAIYVVEGKQYLAIACGGEKTENQKREIKLLPFHWMKMIVMEINIIDVVFLKF